ncbi:MAG: 2,3-diphosphoglycerate-dependent phosphoglycerate mutase [Bdellovibrionaceae bacterium]|nr:2,3-diphosphoglycerate-dependent phosphoglycerate mutase [Pseudobdellovibrionaceae bacterium]MDW8189717.1 2,3-diphosphoglycerate-dependent phosphoglycerate mutase [Pseudobdellovibrionaceae bacterium]
MAKLILVRHGESEWNKENRFTGWIDVDLSPTGQKEAIAAGKILAKEQFEFHWTYTSVLKRAIRTHWIILDQMDRLWLPVTRSWRLNERHYGALQGLNKAETAQKYGEHQVKLWRRSYDTVPPLIDSNHPMHPRFDRRYQHLPADQLPCGESLKMTIARIMPFWNEEIIPRIKQNQTLLIVAHGNSLRGIVQVLENMSPEQLLDLNIPTGIPLLYHLDQQLNLLEKKYLEF